MKENQRLNDLIEEFAIRHAWLEVYMTAMDADSYFYENLADQKSVLPLEIRRYLHIEEELEKKYGGLK